jgi:hypothetical protein
LFQIRKESRIFMSEKMIKIKENLFFYQRPSILI